MTGEALSNKLRRFRRRRGRRQVQSRQLVFVGRSGSWAWDGSWSGSWAEIVAGLVAGLGMDIYTGFYVSGKGRDGQGWPGMARDGQGWPGMGIYIGP